MNSCSKAAPRRGSKRLALLLALTLVPGLLALGLWQLQRGEEKRALLAAMASLPLSRQLPAQPDATPLRVAVEGRLERERYYLLDNRTHQGRAGYEVIGVLRVADAPGHLLVNFGWIAAPAARSQLPAVALPSGSLAVQGWLVAAEPGFQLTDPATVVAARWPRRIQQPDWRRQGAELGLALYPGMLRAETALIAAEPIWQPVNMPPARHYGYAVQWFALALMTLLWLGWWVYRPAPRAAPKEEL